MIWDLYPMSVCLMPHTDSNREPTDYKSVALPIEHTISLTYKATINS